MASLALSSNNFNNNDNSSLYCDDKSLVKTAEDILNKAKIYRVRNTSWFCECCDIYCNSQSQYDVHLISQKHKFVLNNENIINTTVNEETKSVIVNETKSDENNNIKNEPLEMVKQEDKTATIRSRLNFSLAEIAQNPLAIKFQIDAVKYLITEDKKIGKFEKFGFYCKTCDSYMTGQIQLIMHVRGAKHQYYHPNEIPGYHNNSSKQFNPHQKRKNKHTELLISAFDFNQDMNNVIDMAYAKSKNKPNKFFNIQNSAGLQQFYEHYNNSVNNTTIYSIPQQQQHGAISSKLNEESNKENGSLHTYHSGFKTNSNHLFNNNIHQMQSNYKMNQIQRVNDQRINFGSSPFVSQQYNNNDSRNQQMFATYNYNTANQSKSNDKMNIIKSSESQLYGQLNGGIGGDQTCSQTDSFLNESPSIRQYEHHYLYNHPTPPPESNHLHHQYATSSNLQYIQNKSSVADIQLQQTRTQAIINASSSPQIIIQNRLGHPIPVMPMCMTTNTTASPISTRSISYYHPQMTQTHQNQQIHQNF